MVVDKGLTKMVCERWCVTTGVTTAGGREEEAEPGIQNQKQKPHTKLWGISFAGIPNSSSNLFSQNCSSESGWKLT